MVYWSDFWGILKKFCRAFYKFGLCGSVDMGVAPRLP